MILLNTLSITEQFDTFCEFNNITSMEQAVELFSIFGGIKIAVDKNTDIFPQIEEKILQKYKFLRNDIASISLSDTNASKILSALAIGDRRTNSAFKKSSMSFNDGINLVDELCDTGMLQLEKSRFKLANQPYDDTVSEKLHFSTPFARFWFAFISPIFKGIRDGQFDEFYKRLEGNFNNYSDVVFEQLSHELIKLVSKDDPIVNIGRYWDNDISLDLIAKTKSGKLIVGACKYTNSKINKNELTKLKEKSQTLNLDVDIYVLFSKKGFSKELKQLKSEELQLFTVKNFNRLLSNP